LKRLRPNVCDYLLFGVLNYSFLWGDGLAYYFSSQNQSLINKLENVQLDAARIVTGGTKLTGLNRLYEETKWEKLSDRRQKHKLLLII
jgi:hypothetical protein